MPLNLCLPLLLNTSVHFPLNFCSQLSTLSVPMSESKPPSPISQPPHDPVKQPESSNAPSEFDDDDGHMEFPPGTVIAAQPISMVAPEDWNAAGPNKAAGKRRTGKDPTVRPSWLPEDWGYETKVRNSGATTGTVDRYYYDPSGRKFRSKPEVMHFLQTGNKLKRKPDSEGDGASSASPMSKQKKSGAKSKNPQPQGD